MENLADNVIKSFNFLRSKDSLDISIKRQKVFKLFPFNKLSQINSLDEPLVQTLCDVLEELIKCEEFSKNEFCCIEYTIPFLICQLEFMIKCNQEHLIIALINLLINVIEVLDSEAVNIYWENLLFISKLTLHLSKTYDTKVKGFTVFAMLFQYVKSKEKLIDLYKDIANHFNSFKQENNDDILIAITQIALSNCYDNYTLVPEIIYKWIEKDFVNLETIKLNEDWGNIALEILQIVYCRKGVAINLDVISKKLLKQINHLLDMVENEEKQQNSVVLLCYLLDFCKNEILLPNENTLKTVYELFLNFPEHISNWCKTTNDLFYIIAYLEALYASVHWTKEDILHSMRSKLQAEESLSQPVLKSMCYLASVYIQPENYLYVTTIAEPLFDKLKQHDNIKSILTYNVEEVIWLLNSGCNVLRRSIFKNWLEKTQKIDDLQQIMMKCKINDLILNTISLHPEQFYSERVIKIIKAHMDGLLIEEFLLKSSNPNSLGLLFRILPYSPKHCTEICEAIPYIIPSLNNSSLFWTCIYVHKLIQSLSEDKSVVVLLYENSEMFYTLLRAAEKSDKYALPAIKLLRLLMYIQMKHEFSVTHITINIKSIYRFKCSNQRKYWIVEMLLPMLKYLKNNVFLRFNSEYYYIDIYDILLRIKNIPMEAVWDCLKYLLKLENSLAYLESNNDYITFICSNADTHNKANKFMLFILEWLRILNKEIKISQYLPIDIIYNFINNQKSSKVKFYISKILQQLMEKKNIIKLSPWIK